MKRRDFIKLGTATAIFSTTVLPRKQAPKFELEDPIKIYVDPRIELYSVVLYLSDFRGLKNKDGVVEARVVMALDFSYKREIDTKFSSYKGHGAVRLYNEMATTGLFRFGHPPSVMLHLSNPPGLVEIIPVDEFLIKMAGGRKKLDGFIKGMRQFSRDTSFVDFFENHQSAYRKLADGYRRNMEWNYVKDLEEYYGDKQNVYNLILAPMFHPGGFGPRIKTPQGHYEAYAIIGSKAVAGDLPNFGSDDSMRRLCWHEFSHSFVNHLTDSNLEHLREPFGILESQKLPAQAVKQIKDFGLWDVHIADQASEYVVRGVTTRLAFIKLGAKQGNEALAKEKSEGYTHIEAICKCLELYEKQRNKYRGLRDYFPQIVATFEKLAGQS